MTSLQKDNIILSQRAFALQDTVASDAVQVSSHGRDVARQLDEQLTMLRQLQQCEETEVVAAELATAVAIVIQAAWRGHMLRKRGLRG